MYPYATIDDALTDVLRLSKGMTYKNAIAGLPLGGGKCVIVADPSRADKPDLLRAFSRHVQALGGRYWTAIDVGVGPADADILAENCDFVFARASQYPDGFNPSLFTALGWLRRRPGCGRPYLEPDRSQGSARGDRGARRDGP